MTSKAMRVMGAIALLPAAPGPGGSTSMAADGLADAAAARAADRCQRAIATEGRRYVDATLKGLGRCVVRTLACEQNKPGNARCRAKATTRCQKANGASARVAGKVARSVARKCGKTAFDTLRDVLGTLRAGELLLTVGKRLAPSCAADLEARPGRDQTIGLGQTVILSAGVVGNVGAPSFEWSIASAPPDSQVGLGDLTSPTHTLEAEVRLIPGGDSPRLLDAAHSNGDEHIDLVTSVSGGLSTLLGNGDGTFEPQLRIGVGQPDQLAAGDLNGDGAPDLIVGTEFVDVGILPHQ